MERETDHERTQRTLSKRFMHIGPRSPVTYDEALKLLGLAPSDGGHEARRAYLRLLKVHRPERDPESFKRLREAFELLEKRGAPLEPGIEAPCSDPRDEARDLSPSPPPRHATLRARLLELDSDTEKLRLAREARPDWRSP